MAVTRNLAVSSGVQYQEQRTVQLRIHLDSNELKIWSNRLVAYVRPQLPSYVSLRTIKWEQEYATVTGHINKLGKHEFSIALHLAVAERGRVILVQLEEANFMKRLPTTLIINEIFSIMVPQDPGVSYSKQKRQLRVAPSTLLKQKGISFDARISAVNFSNGLDLEVSEGDGERKC